MEKIQARVYTAFYIRHMYAYQLRNIEDGKVILYYENHGSPWINKMQEAEKWLSEQESKRFDQNKVKRPSTKWVLEAFFSADVKVVLDRQPLVGTGPLPEWLRNEVHTVNQPSTSHRKVLKRRNKTRMSGEKDRSTRDFVRKSILCKKPDIL